MLDDKGALTRVKDEGELTEVDDAQQYPTHVPGLGQSDHRRPGRALNLCLFATHTVQHPILHAFRSIPYQCWSQYTQARCVSRDRSTIVYI